ncbi:MAG: type 4a pilus biogenesis protein PilO [Actinobacteria bacterium]|nr:type 4a pilus biogenesis protein PilO [Actinomycetota bacterium]
MKKQVPVTPVVAIALLIVAAVAFFAVLKPKMDAGARLDAEIAELETKVAAASRPEPKVDGEKVEIDVADLFLLAKAMPDADDMPGIILELNAIAGASGIRFVSIQPQAQAVVGAYRTLPITLTFEGNYYDLTDFIYRLRSLVRVDDGQLTANGRLYTLDQIDLHEAQDGFPSIEAVLVVSAYSFGAGATAPPAAGAPPAATTPSSTTTATTTGATTTGATTTTATEGTTQDAAGATN